MIFNKTQYGFWKQENPQPFQYTIDYKFKQSTNIEMSYLRLGMISNYITVDDMSSMSMVDIGCGNGSFVNCCRNKFKNVYGYDVTGDTISENELYSLYWDLIVLSDVLEHFEDINKLFDIKWKYAMISYPETPKVERWEELKSWRHFKPDEHIWCLNKEGIIQWLIDNDCSVLGESNFEDLLRTRWEKTKPNITSLFIKRNSTP